MFYVASPESHQDHSPSYGLWHIVPFLGGGLRNVETFRMASITTICLLTFLSSLTLPLYKHKPKRQLLPSHKYLIVNNTVLWAQNSHLVTSLHQDLIFREQFGDILRSVFPFLDWLLPPGGDQMAFVVKRSSLSSQMKRLSSGLSAVHRAPMLYSLLAAADNPFKNYTIHKQYDGGSNLYFAFYVFHSL